MTTEHRTVNRQGAMSDYPQRCAPQSGSSANAAWIAGRIETLLSHYFQPDQPLAVTEAAMTDWLSALDGMPRPAIEHACSGYLRDQPRRRPTPGDIRQRAGSWRPASGGNSRDGLSRDDLHLLETKILPTARRWLGIPGLADQGRQTLEHWGESV